MLTLCQLPGGPAIPNYSPFCMKVECVLRMLDLEYQVQFVDTPQAGPRGQVPFIIDDGETIGDSRVIVDHLQRKHGLDLDRHLDPLQRATAHAMQVMIEQHLYFALVHARWADDAGWAQLRTLFFSGAPEQIAEMARQHTTEKVRMQGLGRHAPQQIAAFAAADIAAAATLLGDMPFVFGETPGLTDAVLYAFVANLTAARPDVALRRPVLAHANLVAHAERMRARYFPKVPAMAA